MRVTAPSRISISIENMAETARCGRRKQQNPRKKNVDLENALEGSTDKDNNNSSGSSNNNAIGKDTAITAASDASMHASKQCNKFHDTLSAHSGSGEGAEGSSEEEEDVVVNGELLKDGTNTNEEQNIEELLLSGNTAIIYPEAVSDPEDQDGKDGPDTNNNEEDSMDAPGMEGEYCLNCPYCDKGFTRLYILRDHIKLQHSDKLHKFSRYVCQRCNAGFVLKSQLDKHLAFHSPTSQVCKTCHKIFANVYRLQRHMISHDESSDLRKFKCGTCGKAFKFKHHLKEHVRIHSGEKPFQCQNCGKRFSHSGSYSSHMTSKKCWVMNMRMKGGEKSDGSQPEDNSGPVMRSPKPEVNNTTPMKPQVHSTYPEFPRHFLPMDQQHNMPLPQIGLNGTPPQLFPYGHYIPPPGHMINPMMPGLPPHSAAFPPFGFAFPNGIPGLNIPMVGKKDHFSPTRPDDKAEPAKPDSGAEHSEEKPFAPNVTDKESSESSETSPIKEGSTEEKAEERIKRILDAVNATVRIQQKHKEDKHQISKLVELHHKEVDSESELQEVEQQIAENIKPEAVETKNILSEDTEVDVESKVPISQGDQADKKKNDENPAEVALPASLQPVKDYKDHSQEDSAKMEFDDQNEYLNYKCRFCKDEFSSAVDLHQHERYMCKLNEEVQRAASSDGDSTSGSSTGRSTPQHVDTDDEAETLPDKGDEGLYDKDGKRFRVRSMINEEQLAVLKKYYEINPRPRRFELAKIGKEIGFPKRVIQVWFQNMRARDRKLGKVVPYFPSMARFRQGESPSPQKQVPMPSTTSVMPLATAPPSTVSSTSAPFIPIVPQPFSFQSHRLPNMATNNFFMQQHHSQFPFRMNNFLSPTSTMHSTTPFPVPRPISSHSLPLPVDQNTPLDLTVKKDNHGSEKTTAGVLDLSGTRKTPERPQQSLSLTPDQKRKAEEAARLEESVIYKYMRQEGLLPKKGHQRSPSPAHQRALPSMVAPGPSPAHLQIPASAPSMFKPLSIHPHLTQAVEERIKQDFISKLELLHMAAQVASPIKMNQSPRSNYSSNLSDAGGHVSDGDVDDDDGDDLRPGKRMRRKSWKQMEIDTNDGDSNMTLDEEQQQQRKKRKSWKQHKIDVDNEGMYACDQCDKMFSKQSSLARHKYEHSGARPFTCEICSKAFKHKHHLTEHRRLHSGEKPFQCRKCGKRFSHSGSYSQHMNHRYKYCKPSMKEDGGMSSDAESVQS